LIDVAQYTYFGLFYGLYPEIITESELLTETIRFCVFCPHHPNHTKKLKKRKGFSICLIH
jgi:hypothetical protein